MIFVVGSYNCLRVVYDFSGAIRIIRREKKQSILTWYETKSTVTPKVVVYGITVKRKQTEGKEDPGY